MSEFVAITFSREDDAAKALASVRSLEKEGKLRLVDTAVVAKDPDGSVHRKDEMASGTETGIAAGAILGGLLFMVFPVAGIVGGAVVGGLLGRAAAPGIDGAFVKDVSEGLKPGGSALLLLIRDGDIGLLIAAMRPYDGAVRQATLSEEDEQALEHALRPKA